MSRTGNGALIALNVQGKQDQILCDLEGFNKDNSPFTHDHTQFSHYTRYYKSYVRERNDQTDLNWPFSVDGAKVGFVIDPRISGDLLTNMFVKLELPQITNGIWTDKIGRAIIEYIEFRVDSILVERLTDVTLVVKDELFTTKHDKAVKAYTMNGQVYTDSLVDNNYTGVLPLTPVLNKSALKLYIDLGLCFNHRHDYKPRPFPLVSVLNQNVYIDIKFRPKSWFTNTTDNVYAPKITLVTEQVTLTDQERIYLRNNPLKLEYMTIEPLLTVQTDKDAESFSQTEGSSGSVDSITTQLKSSRKTSCVMWFFQNRRFKNLSFEDTQNSNLFLNRYNFSSHENFTAINPIDDGYIEPYYGFNEINFPLCSKIELLYSKNDVKLVYAGSTETIPSTSTFFRNIISQSKGLATPTKNIFSYSFDDEPMKPEPSGSFVESLNDYKLFNVLIDTEQVKSNVYDINILTCSYFSLEFQDGNLVKKI